MDESEVKFTIHGKEFDSKDSISSFSMLTNNQDAIFKTSHLNKKHWRPKKFQSSATDDWLPTFGRHFEDPVKKPTKRNLQINPVQSDLDLD